jgi:hypothetical protein
VVGKWIFDENLRFFMEALAYFSDASFDADDWTGLERALILRPDQLDRERHVKWRLGSARLDLFYEPGGSTVHFTLKADHELEVRAEALVYVLQEAVVRREP